MKRTPLERRTPLRRSPFRPATRTGRNAVARRAIREAVYDRDGGRCLLAARPHLFGPCFGIPLTPHHLVKAWKGGPYVLSNLVTLCSGHNDRVEDEPRRAHWLGLVVWEGETVALAWDRLRDHELVP